uniref:Uncharacterized protein n=1 Tax=Strigamia maritima TaxID=126957 RepID=T1J2U1_STRMM
MDFTKASEEKLREAACFGDEEAVHTLIARGINVNAQHDINGWTALHWAAKRGYTSIVTYLLQTGADKTLISKTGETAASVAEKEEIFHLLNPGGEISFVKADVTPNIIPNYLVNPEVNHKIDVEVAHPKQTAIMKNGNNQYDDELVLKVRVAHSPDPDYIEIEIPRNDLTYSRLLRVCCEELGIDLKHILKIRKLPDTVVRKDKDVKRLRDFQQLELVLTSTRPPNANSAVTAASSPYPSIPGFRNCTILY